MRQEEQRIEPRYLTVKQAAVYMSFSPSQLYHWLADGKIDYIKKGKAVRFDRKVLDRFMQVDKVEVKI